MKLITVFETAIKQCDDLVDLHDGLLTLNTRAIRPELSERIFDAGIIKWPRRDGLWRSSSSSILILGNNNSKLTQKSFSAEKLTFLLRSALVISMAAVDKILHEAISNNFVRLTQEEVLDRFVQIEVSKCYEIAQNARIRKGQGGSILARPGHKIKAEVLKKIYNESYLSSRRIQDIAAALGTKQIFKKYGESQNPQLSYEQVNSKWSKLYQRRNQIAHECDIIRKAKARKASIHSIKSGETKKDIEFAKSMGRYLSNTLE